jgi:hypothetical protein
MLANVLDHQAKVGCLNLQGKRAKRGGYIGVSQMAQILVAMVRAGLDAEMPTYTMWWRAACRRTRSG